MIYTFEWMMENEQIHITKKQHIMGILNERSRQDSVHFSEDWNSSPIIAKRRMLSVRSQSIERGYNASQVWNMVLKGCLTIKIL